MDDPARFLLARIVDAVFEQSVTVSEAAGRQTVAATAIAISHTLICPTNSMSSSRTL
jgi:hypothetical protein